MMEGIASWPLSKSDGLDMPRALSSLVSEDPSSASQVNQEDRTAEVFSGEGPDPVLYGSLDLTLPAPQADLAPLENTSLAVVATLVPGKLEISQRDNGDEDVLTGFVREFGTGSTGRPGSFLHRDIRQEIPAHSPTYEGILQTVGGNAEAAGGQRSGSTSSSPSQVLLPGVAGGLTRLWQGLLRCLTVGIPQKGLLLFEAFFAAGFCEILWSGRRDGHPAEPGSPPKKSGRPH
jgi:hypothetical protein